MCYPRVSLGGCRQGSREALLSQWFSRSMDSVTCDNGLQNIRFWSVLFTPDEQVHRDEYSTLLVIRLMCHSLCGMQS